MGVKIVGIRTVSVVAVIVGNAALDASRIVPLNGWNMISLSYIVHPMKRPAPAARLDEPMPLPGSVDINVAMQP
jgi:hypothetical protein